MLLVPSTAFAEGGNLVKVKDVYGHIYAFNTDSVVMVVPASTEGYYWCDKEGKRITRSTDGAYKGGNVPADDWLIVYVDVCVRTRNRDTPCQRVFIRAEINSLSPLVSK